MNEFINANHEWFSSFKSDQIDLDGNGRPFSGFSGFDFTDP